MTGSWIGRYRQRLAWSGAGLALAVTVAACVVAGMRLHHAVLIERQTLRTEQLSQAVLELDGSPQSSSLRTAAAGAFRSVAGHDAAEGARLRAAFGAYAAAPADQVRLARLERLIGAETARQSHASKVVNPQARAALIVAAVAAALAIALLALLFELERRAGRIDRDNAARAEELIRLRDEFVAVVSHELRTPLTSIAGYLELLADEGTANLTGEQASHLAVVVRSAERLTELVSDLLLVAETDHRPLDLNPTDVDLAALADHAVQAARPAADARGLVVEADHRSRAVARGDESRLAQVLDNLLSNAIKFTPRGGRVVVRTDLRDNAALLEVSDTGPGIAPADRLRLFEPFYRAREATAQAVPGTGLGLTITKAIVDAHRGRIEIESGPAGTTVRVRLPARTAVYSALA